MGCSFLFAVHKRGVAFTTNVRSCIGESVLLRFIILYYNNNHVISIELILKFNSTITAFTVSSTLEFFHV